MSAPSPAAIVQDPPPLNESRAWPYLVDPFPAEWLLNFAGLGRGVPPTPDKTANPNRRED